jgi:hypothetical protein
MSKRKLVRAVAGVPSGTVAAAIDAACDRSSAEWMAKFRRQEMRAYRTGYADAKVRNFRPNKLPAALRSAYKKGYWRCRDDGYGLD